MIILVSFLFPLSRHSLFAHSRDSLLSVLLWVLAVGMKKEEAVVDLLE